MTEILILIATWCGSEASANGDSAYIAKACRNALYHCIFDGVTNWNTTARYLETKPRECIDRRINGEKK